jgi:aspartyl-tRNA(Asn)/glutamyl-tRNA(Gln) amidotransferase subunit A
MSATHSLAAVGPFGRTNLLDIAGQIRRKETTALDVTERALNAAHNYGQELNCFVTIDDEGARQAARVADRELDCGLDRGPLHGIPVGIKDMISTSGLTTTMGSRHFADHVPASDADVVTALRRSGAVIVGKTQTHEFAYGPTSDRAATGPARNPHNPSLMTGGSSGGSGAAVAAGIVPVALGTDTGGSVRVPAALCGVVGMRPTQGALSSEGVFPLSPTLDVVGPLAANVVDTAVAWWALSSRADYKGARDPEWSDAFVPDSSRGRILRLGQVSCNLTKKTSAGLQEATETAIRALSHSGSPIATVDVPEIDDCGNPYKTIQSAEAFAIHCHRVQNSPELFDPEVLDRLEAASNIRGWEYVRALEARSRLRSATLQRTASVDILIMPSVPIDAPSIGRRDLGGEGGWTSPREALLSMTAPWSVLGFPAISVPVPGAESGLPRSVQLVGKPGQEWQLLDAAALLEEGLREAR